MKGLLLTQCTTTEDLRGQRGMSGAQEMTEIFTFGQPLAVQPGAP